MGLAPPRSLLSLLDPAGVSELARRESRNREVFLPPVSAYRWWARRTAAVNGAALAAAAAALGRERLTVADPFAGGGVIAFMGVAAGHSVYAQDINPWAAYGLAATLALPAPEGIRAAARRLEARAAPLIEAAYRTEMSGEPAWIAHTLRVAVSRCGGCGRPTRLFPHALVSLRRRKERGDAGAWLACPEGHLFAGRADQAAGCPACGAWTDPAEERLPRRRATCPGCGREEALADREPWTWEIALVERTSGSRRELGPPTAREIAQAEGAQWRPARELGEIPEGQETAVLRRHGAREWGELYPRRQRAVLEAILGMIAEEPDESAAAALRLAALGTAEMAGHLSRWDRFYLKSYEAMAGHRFNLTTLAAEPNVWGTAAAGRGTLRRRLAALERAAAWLGGAPRECRVVCGDSARLDLADGSVDLVLTDPPYHDDVQYGELSLPLRAWAGLGRGGLAGEASVGHAPGDLPYRELLRRIFAECRRALRPEGRLVFSYANRQPAAWADLLGALQGAGLRAAGFAVLHSENERDSAKRGVRACALDLLLELSPRPLPGPGYRPERIFGSEEEDLLHAVGGYALRIGDLEPGWEAGFIAQLRGMAFLR